MNQLQIVTVAAISLAALTGLLTVHEAYAMSHITGNTTNASSMMAGNMTGDNQTMMAGNMTAG